MSHETLARPYARAAFDFAREAKALGEWSSKLDFAHAIAASPQIKTLISSPKLVPNALVGLFLPPDEKADSTFARFISTLAENRRLALLPEIASGYAVLKREAEGVLKVRVRTAVPVDGAQAEALSAALQRRFGRHVELESIVDESVIGGAVIDTGDIVIDGSVRGQLERLGQTLMH